MNTELNYTYHQNPTGKSLPYLEFGNPDKPTMLFIHGLALRTKAYIRLFHLFDQYHVIAPDIPNFGTELHDTKTAPTITNAVRRLASFIHTKQINPHVVAAHSLGATLAYQLIETSVISPNVLMFFSPALPPFNPSITNIISSATKQIFWEAVFNNKKKSVFAESMKTSKWFLRQFLNPTRLSTAQRSLQNVELPQYTNNRIKTHIYVGKHDYMINMGLINELTAYEHISIHTVNSGHSFCWTNPEYIKPSTDELPGVSKFAQVHMSSESLNQYPAQYQPDSDHYQTHRTG